MDPKRKDRKTRFSANTKLILKETYVLIGERSLTCTQSTITPGAHLTFKIAGLKKIAVSKVLENLDKPDKICCVKGVRKP